MVFNRLIGEADTSSEMALGLVVGVIARCWPPIGREKLRVLNFNAVGWRSMTAGFPDDPVSASVCERKLSGAAIANLLVKREFDEIGLAR